MYSKKLVFAAACLGMLLFGIVFLSLGSVNNMLSQRLGLGDLAIGTLAALLPAGILVGSLVFGPIVDRFGYRWMLIAASVIVGAALEGLAFARSEGLVQFYIFLIGFGGGILNGATNALAADVSEGERGAKLSLLGVFFGIGALTMPSTLALLSERFELHRIVAGIGGLVLVPVLFCLMIRFPPPKQRAGVRQPKANLSFLRDPFFVFAALAMAIQSGMEGMSNDWMARFFRFVTLEGEYALEKQAQLALVALTSAMLITRLVLSRLLTRTTPRLVLMVSIATAAAGALVLMYAPRYEAALLGPFLIGAGVAAGFPVTLGLIADRYPDQSGTTFSTIFIVALIGNMAINKTFGALAEQYGVQRYTTMLLGLLACSAILLLLVTHFNNRSGIRQSEDDEPLSNPMA